MADTKLYRAIVPISDEESEQELILIERENQRYGFVSCLSSGLYAHTDEEMADNLKKYMEENQVTPLEIQDSELVKLVVEATQITSVGVSRILNERLIALLESV